MSLVTCDVAISMDGYATGVNQTRERPFGTIEYNRLHDWMFDGAEDNRAEVAAILDAGAFIMGRRMFSSDSGEWDLDWRGWWGEDPPYHAPVFVLTHHARDDLVMEGGTTFHFETAGIRPALRRARAAAGPRNVAVAGGASTINQFLAAGLLDELRVHVTPTVFGGGERLFDGVPPGDYAQVSARGSNGVTHITYRPRSGAGASSDS
jgi:dihydrofolate reductase